MHIKPTYPAEVRLPILKAGGRKTRKKTLYQQFYNPDTSSLPLCGFNALYKKYAQDPQVGHSLVTWLPAHKGP